MSSEIYRNGAREHQVQNDGKMLVNSVIDHDRAEVGYTIFGGFYTDYHAMARLFQAAADYARLMDATDPRLSGEEMRARVDQLEARCSAAVAEVKRRAADKADIERTAKS